LAAKENFMADDPAPTAGVRAQRRTRRDTKVARRERYFNMMVSGYTCGQIAKMLRTSAATVRREVDRALAERRLDAPEHFARVQVARLAKALRLAEAAIELGELKAVATYLRVVAALDRYHELAAGSPPPPRRSSEPPPLALPSPPKTLTFAAPPGDEPSKVEEAAREVTAGDIRKDAARPAGRHAERAMTSIIRSDRV
jgi:DNA-binding CsgD family transcriptional regulator